MQSTLQQLIEQHNQAEKRQDREAFSPWMGVNCEIHPDDDIFRFVYNHESSINPVRDYLADGWRSMLELMVPLEQINHPLIKSKSILEFACGYGRLTRHLVRFMDRRTVYASDIAPGAADFVSDKFGVKGFDSSNVPESVDFPCSFDIVFALSLFSHLPEATWHRWLHRLFDAVEPGGVLVFSTHGSGFAHRHSVNLDRRGYFFSASSESSCLDNEVYGTTITSAEFVRQSLESLSAKGSVTFLPDHFWSGQDGWLITKRGFNPLKWLSR